MQPGLGNVILINLSHAILNKAVWALGYGYILAFFTINYCFFGVEVIQSIPSCLESFLVSKLVSLSLDSIKPSTLYLSLSKFVVSLIILFPTVL